MRVDMLLDCKRFKSIGGSRVFKLEVSSFPTTTIEANIIPYLEDKNWAHEISSSCPQLNIKALFIFESII